MNKKFRIRFGLFCSDNRKSKTWPESFDSAQDRLHRRIENPKWAGIFAIVLTFVFGEAVAGAQQPAKVPRIGFLDMGSASDPRNTLGLDAFREGLRQLGYVEGKNINIDYRYTERKFERLPELAQELVRLRVDIRVANNTTAAQVAKKLTTTIPVVFTTGANPVTTGLVASLARPGGNVTGVTTNSPELVGKRLGLLKEAVPKVSHFAFLMPADTSTIRAMFDDAQATAKTLGVTFQAVEVKAPNPDFEAHSDTWSRSALEV